MTPRRQEMLVDVIAGLRENLSWFPHYQAYLRDHQPPALVFWGWRDRYRPAGAALAYRRDLPDARIHLLEDAGLWPLETHPKEVAALTDEFLQSVMERS